MKWPTLSSQMKIERDRNVFVGAGRIIHHIQWQYPRFSPSRLGLTGKAELLQDEFGQTHPGKECFLATIRCGMEKAVMMIVIHTHGARSQHKGHHHPRCWKWGAWRAP
jgi:hypothetical protein